MANTYIKPSSFKPIMLSRLDYNDSAEALLTRFYNSLSPTINNFNFEGITPTIVPDGTIFRSSSLGTLFIKDSKNHQNNPIYGSNFTRNGIGYIVENNITALTANVQDREKGEIMITPSPNTRIYVKSNSGDSTFTDVGNPPPNGVTTAKLVSGAVTEDKVDENVAVLSQSQIFNGTQIIIKDSQTAITTVAMVATNETGNVVVGLNANGNSAAGISHARNGDGVSIVGSDYTSLAEINASDYLVNGSSIGAGSGGLQSVQVFTANGTWTRPSGITKIVVYGVGGGGGGGGSYTGTHTGRGAGGGGGGGYAWRLLDVTSIPSANVVIGAGGTGGAANSTTPGATGGTTSFDSWITCNGGEGGGGTHPSATRWRDGGTGGTASGGNVNIQGQDGSDEAQNNAGSSMLGQGAHSVQSEFVPGSGIAPPDGKLYGGGGQGGWQAVSESGGDGADGIIVVMEYE